MQQCFGYATFGDADYASLKCGCEPLRESNESQDQCRRSGVSCNVHLWDPISRCEADLLPKCSISLDINVRHPPCGRRRSNGYLFLTQTASEETRSRSTQTAGYLRIWMMLCGRGYKMDSWEYQH